MRLWNSSRRNQPAVWDVSCHKYAHRGLWRPEGPSENSIPSFAAARRWGFGVELDVTLSGDGEPVVFHDQDLKRMCGLETRLRDLDLKDLERMRLPDGSTIPSLGRAICELGETPTLIELKAHQDPEEIAWQVLRQLAGAQGRFALMSFNLETVRALLASGSDSPVGLLLDASDERELSDVLDWALTRGCAFAGPNVTLLRRPEIEAFPLPCVVWTIRRREDLPDRPGWAPIFEGLQPEEVSPSQ